MSSANLLKQLYPSDFVEHLTKTRLLLVGVGGIGCELLKNLSVLPIQEIEIIDLDTVEFSNLNRQFYFRKHHVGKSKAQTAAEVVQRLNPSLKIKAIHGNILSPEFDLKYFGSFDCVVLALDNREARSHVNWNCMLSNTLMLDAGTSGFQGQATIHLRGLTRCYDCYMKQEPKRIQVCTIRTTPSKPIHCLIWAKHIFDLLFSGNIEDNPLIDILQEIEGKGESQKDKDSFQTSKKCYKIFFEKFIVELKDSNEKKFNYLKVINSSMVEDILQESIKYENVDEEKIYEPKFYSEQFLHCLTTLFELKKTQPVIKFEKDDDIHMRFVISCANLRSVNFSVDKIDEYNGKSKIGNIIPAICSSNSIVAGLEVTEMLKFLFKKFESQKESEIDVEKMSFYRNNECFISHTDVQRVKPNAPLTANKDCKVCQVTPDSFLMLEANLETSKFQELIDAIKTKNKQEKYEYSVFQGSNLIFEEGDYLEEDEIEDNKQKLQSTMAEVFKSKNQQIRLSVVFDDNCGGLKLQVIVSINPETVSLKVVEMNEDTKLVDYMKKTNKRKKVRKIKQKKVLNINPKNEETIKKERNVIAMSVDLDSDSEDKKDDLSKENIEESTNSISKTPKNNNNISTNSNPVEQRNKVIFDMVQEESPPKQQKDQSECDSKTNNSANKAIKLDSEQTIEDIVVKKLKLN